ncbi:hypothetical protein PISL3812_01034 [Talaromyces islandicus]|uniref:ATPase synthesis protein 25 n=1 Tax=Talaromyces islandicus TaxID=28573 RepID=A0A0U1LKX0_TALIS|nr:hypothetical protein PISL3812_01034 [Talaromyces islandicus]
MAAALARSATCQACRYSTLQTFAAFSGLAITQTARFPNNPPLRRFSTVPNLRTEHSNHSANPVENEPSHEDQSVNDTNTELQSVPWYLRVETPVESHPVGRRQQIPPVPENSPAILGDLLQHLSVEIGLDDLTLLDLRGRNPPSALGGNVIMVVGTARGIKHLNVSADRFCRWLRSTYKLRPYADGLLGRNELKIKLRRKTRKARVAGSSGSTAASSDDGITTGWICVNAGLVEDPGAETLARQGVFEGFGKVQSGTRIIVQMFTEEKRALMDLEQLWAPKRNHQVDPNSIPEETPKETPKENPKEDPKVVRPGSIHTNHHESNHPLLNTIRPPSSISFDQKRKFATSSTQLREQEFYHYLTTDENIFQTNSSDLGTGPNDRDSTSLLRRTYDVAKDSQFKISLLRLMLAAAGVTIRHPAYTKEHLWSVYMEHTASGFYLGESAGLDVARSFIAPRSDDQRDVLPSTRESDVEHALRVLDFLSLEGSLRLHIPLFVILYKALIMLSVDQDVNTTSERSLRIRNVMETFPQEIKGYGAWDMMRLRLEAKDIEGFWQIWHSLPFMTGSRTHDDYEFLFRSMAWCDHAASARESLATWIPMMLREQPPIEPQESLLLAIAYCIQAAGYEDLSFSPELTSSSYWAKLRPTILSYLRTLPENYQEVAYSALFRNEVERLASTNVNI